MNSAKIVFLSFRIEVNFNVNHSVDTDAEPEIHQNMDKPEVELKSKPTFEVDIKRGNRTMGFTCSFVTGSQDQSQDDSYSKLCYLVFNLILFNLVIVFNSENSL